MTGGPGGGKPGGPGNGPRPHGGGGRPQGPTGRPAHATGRPGTPSDKPFTQPKCVRCGGKHWSSRCPDKADPRLPESSANMAAMEFLMTAVAEEDLQDTAGCSGPVEVCMPAEVAEGPVVEHSLLASAALRAGKAVLDCGATHSIGSVDALDALAQLNAEKHGSTRMTVDTTKKAMYQFGDGLHKKCVSQATFEVSAGARGGRCPINGFEAPGIPILLAVQALENLGAVIDFETSIACFKRVNPNVLVELERAPNGHRLLSLVDDLLAQETTDPEKVAPMVAFAKRILEVAAGGAPRTE